MKYQYRNINSSRGIRLLKLSPGAFNDQITFDLVPAILRDTDDKKTEGQSGHSETFRSYVALSYTWGDQTDCMEINCETSTLRITRILHTALRYIRIHHSNGVYVWADAICINQEDLEEREQQVQLMGDIYSQAETTLLWLGEETDDVRGWADALVELRERLPDNWEDVQKVLAIPTPKNVRGHILTDSRWKPIRALTRRPWFTRKWVVQEVVRSKDPKIVCGMMMVHWSILQQLITALLYSNVLGHVHADHADALSQVGLSNAASIARIRNLSAISSRKQTLEILIYFCAGFQCSDPRDQIYALLGIASTLDGVSTALQMQPSYTVATKSVYTQFATRLILYDRSINTFSWRYSDPCMDPKLPSWVPNPVSLLPGPDYIPPGHADPWASGNTEVVASILGNSKLLIRGRGVDNIKLVGSLGLEPASHEQMKSYIANPRIIPEQWLVWRAECRAIAHEALDLDDGTESLEAFWRTLIWNCTDDSRIRASSAFVQEVKNFVDIYMEVNIGQLQLSQEEADTCSLRTIKPRTALAKACEGRRFATTANGRFALVPIMAAPGDVICIFDGGCHPHVLRSCGGKELRLLGACYLHGMMEGEAMGMKELKVETFTIV